MKNIVIAAGYEEEMKEVARLISKALKNHEDEKILNEVRENVKKLTGKFPLKY